MVKTDLKEPDLIDSQERNTDLFAINVSTNPHFVSGASIAKKESHYTIPDKGYLVTNPTHHYDIELTAGHRVIGFVQTVSGVADVRRLVD
jgi:hypothetical protein